MGLTSYNRDYSALKGQEKIDAGVRDTREYLGEDRYELFIEAMKHKGDSHPSGNGMEFEQFANWLDFCGVRGYPIRAMWDHVFPDRAGRYNERQEVSAEDVGDVKDVLGDLG